MIDPNLWIFDFEVFSKDTIVVFEHAYEDRVLTFHNDNAGVAAFMEDKPLLCGFNSKHYDNHIMKAVLCGADPETVKQINDWIIVDEIDGWNIPLFRNERVSFDSFDLMDDVQIGTSLKSFEAHYGMNIEESTVDFNIDRKLTEEEVEEVIRYCKHDVHATKVLFHLRKNYLMNKITLGEKKGYSPRQSLKWTNAKLTSVYLDAKKPEVMWTDEREYHYPDKLLKQYVPQEVFDFFDKLKDPSIPRDEVFSSSLEITVGGCPCKIAYGGIHGAIPTYQETETETRKIRNKDVASYYPHLMLLPLDNNAKWGFCSRAIPDPKIFDNTLEERLAAKDTGDKATNLALKLVLNTTYGCMGNGQYVDGKYVAYNDLYDPLMCRSVCITGQLFLLELTCHLLKECPTLRIIQLNTDGIMVSLDDSDEQKWQEITQEWQDRTGFELEEDFIHKIVQKDVNNYVEVPVEGKPKLKGGMLVRGISEAGAFKINNTANVVAKAVADYFIDGIAPEDTINGCDKLLDFQLISKASSLYTESWQEEFDIEMIADFIPHVTGVRKVPVQKVNRVYATADPAKGTLYKRHKSGGIAKVSGLPDHCVIDNRNELDISVIDRQWYIDLAHKQINDFLGISPPRVNKRKLNSYKKTIIKLLEV